MKLRRTPEQELLIACARAGDVGERRTAIAAALERAPESGAVGRLAREHGLLPLVAGALDTGELAPELDPGGALRGEAKSLAYRGVLLTGELLSLLRRFEQAGIPALPFKGPALAAAAYGAPTRRQFVDLDLLVRPEQYLAAGELLVAAGYVERRDAWSAVRHLSHERTFDGRDGRVEVDLHRRAFSRELPAIPADELWSGVDRVRIGDAEVPSIRPEWLLVVLAEHAHKHLWARLGWIADLAHLIAARPGLDWQELLDNARRVGGARVLGVGLTLAAELLAGPVPQRIAERVARDAAVRPLVDQLAAGLFARPVDDDAARLDLGALQWRSRERWRDRMRFALTPNEDDWLVVPLPAPLLPVYYLIRPLRLAVKYGWRWARLSRRAGSRA